MGPLWGIDLGGTKIEGVILDGREQPQVLKRLRVPTEQELGYDHIIDQMVKLVEVMTAETGIKPSKIGIGTPGTLEPSSQRLKNCNTTVLNGMMLKKDLENALNIPIKMANDANCFAVAEANLGAVQGYVDRAGRARC